MVLYSVLLHSAFTWQDWLLFVPAASSLVAGILVLAIGLRSGWSKAWPIRLAKILR